MQGLNPDAQKRIQALARQHGVSEDAVMTLLRALVAGHGRQAQFSHPDLGGMGQWSEGGMIMVGDMFNQGLKAKVDALASDLSAALGRGEIEMREPERAGASDRDPDRNPDRNPDRGGGRWPKDLGTPGSSGSQNDMHYAVFPDTRRLAVERQGKVAVYDTADHRISGVSQAQSSGQTLAFSSQHGPVSLESLKQISGGKSSGGGGAPASSASSAASSSSSGGYASHDDVFAKVERLHELYRKGMLNQDEFEAKKKELLSRL